ncbi:MAG TPA: tRNA lysidine(34) synthetase TilS [Euzebyales bacterium]
MSSAPGSDRAPRASAGGPDGGGGGRRAVAVRAQSRDGDAAAGEGGPPAATGRTHAPSIGALPAGLSRDELVAEVLRTSAPVPVGAAVVVAVSGGPDSTAMAHLLSIARPDLRLDLVHVRHGLRDDAADAAAAAAHAAALEAVHHEHDVEVRVGSRGPEAAARAARYRALLDHADAVGARWMTIGHTADDQAETVLLNLVRGSGLRGVGAMRPLRSRRGIGVLRPLLRIRRADVAAFIAGEGLLAVADPTNRDPDQRRARARHDVLPTLERLAGGPGDAVGALNRVAELARIDTDALDALAEQHARQLTVVWGVTRAVRLDLLRRLPRALSTRVLRTAAAAVGAGVLSAAAVDRIMALEPGEALHLPTTALVSCGGGWLGFAPGDAEPLRSQVLTVPGTTQLDQLGLDIHVEWPWPMAPAPDPAQLDLGPPPPVHVGEVDDEAPPAQLAPSPPGSGPRARMWAVFGDDVTAALARGADLTVRTRHDGDRLRCPAGVRKLQDLLVDAHVPRACRDLVPIVVDEHDEPLWIPGVAQRACDRQVAAGMRMWVGPTAVLQPT